MIEISRSHPSATPVVKVLGLGGAGSNVIDRLILDGFSGCHVVALNTDIQALNASVAVDKVHLGKVTTRGLGTGGDPELGYTSAEEATEEITSAVDGADMVFLCVGLGGGTGSGAAPLVSHLARKSGATVIALVTMPFGFEGKRRMAQAKEALSQLEYQANLILCFENDAMGNLVAPTAGIQQAFVTTDQILSQAIRSIIGMVSRRGLVSIALDDLNAAMGRSKSGGGLRCLFGHGESDSSNRAHEALERALRSPLMDKGRMLADARHVVIHIAGGPELTLNEVTVLMDEFNRHISEHTRVSFGVSTEASLCRRLVVSVISSTASVIEPVSVVTKSAQQLPVAPMPERRPPAAPAPTSAAELFVEPVEEIAPLEPAKEHPPVANVVEPVVARSETPSPTPSPAPRKQPPSPNGAASKAAAAAAQKKEEKAEQMTLEPANRGRFEKSEPTIVDGEDLDVPTFLRKSFRR